MNPAEEIPPEVAHRAYYRQPVWKRIVVIAAGPAVNIVLALPDPGRDLLGQRHDRAAAARGRDRARPAGRGGPASPATCSSPSTASGAGGRLDDQAKAISARSPRTSAPRPPTAGCRAAEPVTLTVARGGELRTVPVTPVYDAELKRTRLGFSFGGTHYAAGPLRSAAAQRASRCGSSRAARSRRSRASSRPRSARRSRGVVGSYEVTRQAIELDTTRALFLLAVISLSLGVINLFPFLPLDGGHIFWALAEKVRGTRDPLQRHGARRVRRLRAGDRPVHDRLHERHRPPDRRGLRRGRVSPGSPMASKRQSTSAASRSAAARPSSCRR